MISNTVEFDDFTQLDQIYNGVFFVSELEFVWFAVNESAMLVEDCVRNSIGTNRRHSNST